MKERDYNEVLELLNKEVIGHSLVKQKLITLFLCHYEKLKMLKCGMLNSYKKQSAICIGNSGTGKTMLIETLCKILEVDFIVVNATNITATGWKGNDIEDYLYLLYQKCNQNKERFQKAVIFIDEIDKKTNFYGNSTDYEAKDQSALLKMVESDKVIIKKDDRNIVLDTSGILFIFAGAFAHLTRRPEKPISIFDRDEMSYYEPTITQEDLIRAGMMPELVGRIGMILQFNDLTAKDMKDILLNSQSSCWLEWKQYFKSKSINLEATEEAIDQIVEEALSYELGARMLNSIVNDLFYHHHNELMKSPKSILRLILADDKTLDFEWGGKVIVQSIVCNDCYLDFPLRFIPGGYNTSNKIRIGSYVSELIKLSFQYIHYDSKDEIKGTEDILTSILVYICDQCSKEDYTSKSIIKLLNVSFLAKDDVYDIMLEHMNKDEEAYRKCYRSYVRAKGFLKYGFDLEGLKKTIYTYSNQYHQNYKGGKYNVYTNC